MLSVWSSSAQDSSQARCSDRQLVNSGVITKVWAWVVRLRSSSTGLSARVSAAARDSSAEAPAVGGDTAVSTFTGPVMDLLSVRGQAAEPGRRGSEEERGQQHKPHRRHRSFYIL